MSPTKTDHVSDGEARALENGYPPEVSRRGRAGKTRRAWNTRALASRELVWQRPQLKGGRRISVKVLGSNDLHGHLSTNEDASGNALGGAAVLGSYLSEASRGFEGRSFIVHAGDLFGASPPSSALYQDEPTIRALEMMGNEHCTLGERADPRCNVIMGLGNHEFDEGIDELRPLLYGGNHERGPFLGDDYRPPGFPILAANVIDAGTLGVTAVGFPPIATRASSRQGVRTPRSPQRA